VQPGGGPTSPGSCVRTPVWPAYLAAKGTRGRANCGNPAAGAGQATLPCAMADAIRQDVLPTPNVRSDSAWVSWRMAPLAHDANSSTALGQNWRPSRPSASTPSAIHASAPVRPGGLRADGQTVVALRQGLAPARDRLRSAARAPPLKERAESSEQVAHSGPNSRIVGRTGGMGGVRGWNAETETPYSARRPKGGESGHARIASSTGQRHRSLALPGRAPESGCGAAGEHELVGSGSPARACPGRPSGTSGLLPPLLWAEAGRSSRRQRR
jgi:hypothetical protein